MPGLCEVGIIIFNAPVNAKNDYGMLRGTWKIANFASAKRFGSSAE